MTHEEKRPAVGNANLASELQRAYYLRFNEIAEYRIKVWKILTKDFFQRWIDPEGTVLDLGSGYGEFINHIQAGKKYAMDLNPDSEKRLKDEISFLRQDCSKPWPLPAGSLDVVFTSNFFEHLPNKDALQATVANAYDSLKPGGRLICLGPNARSLGGHYWDFWDHHVALTNQSLCELLTLQAFEIEVEHEHFLPYTMVNKAPPPLFFVSLYIKMPLAWRLFGKQFLVIGRKPK